MCGTWDAMIPDAEILSLLSTILSKLDVGEFTIKVGFITFLVPFVHSILHFQLA